MKSKNILVANLPVIFSALYAGVLLGVSFLATPIKFSAPSITLPIALGVGNVTFHALIKLEWLLLCCCFIALLLNARRTVSYIIIAVICALLMLQTFWLLPALDQRLMLIQQGQLIEASYHHILYIVIEVIKVIALLSVSVLMIPSMKS